MPEVEEYEELVYPWQFVLQEIETYEAKALPSRRLLAVTLLSKSKSNRFVH